MKSTSHRWVIYDHQKTLLESSMIYQIRTVGHVTDVQFRDKFAPQTENKQAHRRAVIDRPKLLQKVEIENILLLLYRK